MASQARWIFTEGAWQEIAAVLARVKPKAGSPPQQSDRLCIAAVLSLARMGIPWRDVPAECGQWDAVSHRFRRWEANGVWRKRWEDWQSEDCKLAKHIFIERTIVRAHQHAAGDEKKRRASGTGSGTFSGWIIHQNPCRMER